MQQVDFYLLSQAAPRSRENFVCRLAETLWQRGHRLYIYTAGDSQSRLVDRLLWTFRDISFVPHEIYLPAGAAPGVPVCIGRSDAPCPGTEVLINLDLQVPMCYTGYARIAEIINDEPGVRDAGRERYRFYKNAGMKLEMHEMG